MPPFPKVFRVRQNFQTTGIESIPETVAQALERLRPALKPGASVAVGAGSRGITNIAAIVRAACDTLRSFGAAPFIIPAMGSHGGATGEGQRHILAEYGITEEAMGVPIRASMEVIELGQTPSGVRVFLDRNAAEADFILPVNRVKPHTDFKGETESGLVKMSAVGLGKLAGATEYHRQAYHLGFPRVFQEVAQVVLDTGHLLGGVAILENALHETAKIVAVGRENFIAEDRELLREAKAMMPRLPCEEIDLLIVDEIGKNISGAGLDTNIIGRSCNGYVEGVPTHENTPRIRRILVCDLTPESNGNGVGIGMADFTTARFMDKLDLKATVINVLTAMTPFNAKLPVYFQNDREAIETGLRTAGLDDLTRGRVVRIKNTLSLAEIEMSENYLDEVKSRGGLTVTGDPREMSFDERGNLRPFGAA
ncbi:MAG TPA: lactate racemase domain-containing protein [Blastocatellia bacterium]|nr:lactate racemase domain-containing protein [Blastocatellia bacterium]